ncbi:hypothetical protein JC2156_12130 [Weissella koreensis KCTC 3621]|nr:hypothetical protein JC2156_12130 [Weissella koreensis KCTC 3621]
MSRSFYYIFTNLKRLTYTSKKLANIKMKFKKIGDLINLMEG